MAEESKCMCETGRWMGRCKEGTTTTKTKTSTTEQSRNIARSLMLSNKRLLTLASPIYLYYSEWLEQYTLLPPLICDTLVSENKHSPACSTASMLWPSPIFTGFTLLNVIRNVTSTRSSGDAPIHPDNIGGWVIVYPPTYVFWAPNGSGPIYIY